MQENLDQKLSSYELQGLDSTFDLASAYPRQAFSPGQKIALQDVGALLEKAHQTSELEAKREFEAAFFALAGQSSIKRLPAPIAAYSGSVAIEIMVNYLRLNHKTVTLMHPTFDSLADTIKRHGIHLEAMHESQMLSLTPDSPPLETDVLYMICPNNPTGRYPSQAEFSNIVEYCRKYNVLLIIDFCFRFFGDFWDYDQYQILQDSGIDFITTEDTGKTWPCADLKIGMLVTSASLYGAVGHIAQDFLVGVSPFNLRVLSRLLQLENRETQRVLSQQTADTNRQTLKRLLAESPIMLRSEMPRITVEWLTLPEDWISTDYAMWLYRRGIQLLPGEQFYWSSNERGRGFVRIALLREPKYFETAIRLLAELTAQYCSMVPQGAKSSQKIDASS
jgi:aspartate/methionine/tyrosine aminotransferase